MSAADHGPLGMRLACNVLGSSKSPLMHWTQELGWRPGSAGGAA